jgi:hypothetical protein
VGPLRRRAGEAALEFEWPRRKADELAKSQGTSTSKAAVSSGHRARTHSFPLNPLHQTTDRRRLRLFTAALSFISNKMVCTAGGKGPRGDEGTTERLTTCFKQTALFNFQSLLLVILLLICTSAYVHAIFPTFMNNNKQG